MTLLERGGASVTPDTHVVDWYGTNIDDLVGNLDMQANDWNDVVSDYQYDALNRLNLLTHYVDANGDRVQDVSEDILARYEYFHNLDGARNKGSEKGVALALLRLGWRAQVGIGE